MKKAIFSSILSFVMLIILASCGGSKTDDKNKDTKESVKTLKTINNLKSAINGETTPSAKYKAFSEKAKAEGYDQIAGLFAATSNSESIHAANHMKALEKMGEKFVAKADTFEVKTSKENLEAAIKGESYEVNTMYPDFIKTAESDQATDAKKSFNWAFETEKKHKELYQKVLDALNNKKVKDLPMEYFVCPKCGNTFTSANVDEKCGFCGTAKSKYLGISWTDVNRK